MNTNLLRSLHDGAFALKRKNTVITLLRHANAVAATDEHDSLRKLSEKGKRQCAAQKQTMQSMSFDAVYRSPLSRVWETLIELDPRTSEIAQLPELVVEAGTDSHVSGVIDAAYDILGNCPLAGILKFKEVAAAMDEFAASTNFALKEQWYQKPIFHDHRRPFQVLVAGHTWLIPIIGYYLAGGNEQAKRYFLFTPMGECDIVQIGLDEGGCPTWRVFPCPAC